MGLLFTVDYDEMKKGLLHQETYMDSDLAGDRATSRSCSGWTTSFVAGKMRCLLDWGAKKQASTARHTPEAEVVAAADAVARSAAPIWSITEQVWRTTLPEHLFIEAEAGGVILSAGLMV